MNASDQWELFYSVVQGTQKTIGVPGGSVTSQIGATTHATLDIPRNALSADTEITILIGPLPESVDPAVVTVPRAFTFGPDGQTFTKNIDAIFNYTDAELEGGDPQTLKVYIWDSQTSSWSEKTGSVHTGKKELTVVLDHFSLFGVAARAVKTEFIGLDKKKDKSSTSILPIRFKLNYVDTGEALDANEITLQILNSDQDPVSPLYTLGKGKDSIDYNGKNQIYSINVSLKYLTIPPGTYTIKVYRSEVAVGWAEFEVLE